MSRKFTIESLKDTPCWGLNPQLHGAGKKEKAAPKGHKIKDWMGLVLETWAKAKGVELKTEYRFDEVRRWRFDWCVPSLKVGWEYEGVVSAKSRHTSLGGYTVDTEKYSQAALLGWRVLRYTALNHKRLETDLEKIKTEI